MKTALVLLLSLHLGSCCPKEKYLEELENSPNFTCLKRDGPYFETRAYERSAWIRTRVGGNDNMAIAAANNELKKFVRFLKDKDVPKDKVDQFDNVWPVVINHTGDEKIWISWFVPQEMQRNISKWVAYYKNPAVEALHLPQSVFHIWKFSGYPSLKAGKENAKNLLSKLNCFYPDLNKLEFSGAGYEKYFSIKHHNEVWIRNSTCSVSNGT